MFFSRENELHDLAGDDAYRSWLISRNQAPIVHHSGEMHWKRLQILARHAVRHVKGFFAAIRVALVADKMRRAQRHLEPHGIRVPKSRINDRRAT
ncbi:hypothetical protein [Tardiphaga sp.]|uniref:hypothetical protein n=1 Tax=Tardiphaga sp. TaxID=1926292 RepID=UPI002610932A|nr:hypothetical protein [Tardiphaga sp.]MDB5618319.1 hypothetical protein [Tardiphaga sp.]